LTTSTLDIVGLNNIEQVAKWLIELGWNESEVQVYIVLVRVGEIKASWINRHLHWNRMRLYRTLDRLVASGRATANRQIKPLRFKSVPFQEILEREFAKREQVLTFKPQAIAILEKIENSIPPPLFDSSKPLTKDVRIFYRDGQAFERKLVEKFIRRPELDTTDHLSEMNRNGKT